MNLGLSDDEVAARRSGIGASDAASIVAGGEEWIRLWRIKTGRAKDRDLYDELRELAAAGNSQAFFMLKNVTRESLELSRLMGHVTEDLNCFWYQKQTGRAVCRRREKVRDAIAPYLFANLDGVTLTSKGHEAYIDFKHVGRAGEATELRYVAQCTHAAHILRLDWWCLSTFVGNSRWELLEAEVDPFFTAEYLDKCAEFWGYVERDDEPPAPPPVPVPTPRPRRIIQLEDEFRDTWPNWAGDMLHQFGIFADTDAAAKRNAIARDDIKKLLPEDVGTVTRGRIKVHRDVAGAVRISLLKERKC